MHRAVAAALTVFTCVLFATLPSARADEDRGGWFQIGVGAHYWHSIETASEEESFSEDGIAWSLSTRLFPRYWVHLGFEVEQFPDEYAGLTEDIYAPAGYLVVGKGVYAAMGAGVYYSDGEFYTDDPFYAFRVGIMAEALPSIYLDINANYRFESTDDLEAEVDNIDTDTVTLGAALRIEF